MADSSPTVRLPQQFTNWFQQKGWHPHPHQLAMVDSWQNGHSSLLIAPTGSGKTLSGFLPSLLDLAASEHEGIHTLYISPLKALATDIERNLMRPVTEMGLPITIESRTGDTPQSKRNRQRTKPPHILLTTPESFELMLGWPDASSLFATIKTIIIDEIHALSGTKRGDLLSLSLAKCRRASPDARAIGYQPPLQILNDFHHYLKKTQKM